MNMEKIEQIARDCMRNRQEQQYREPGWLYHHGHRVARIALRLADELDLAVDRDVMVAGALFHDIGKGSEPHNEVGASITRKALTNACMPDELDAICDIIRSHNQRGLSDQYSDAVKIVQDADEVDHVGPIALWMSFYWSGMHNETFDDHVHFIEGAENANTQKLMRGRLNYDVSRRIFDERIAYEKQFFSEFKRIYLEGI
ncbi:MAG: HD domain-containing protein [Anaerolineaceae bacterium]|nr:HD domain-containing protein [Anaerolineaceae bacterium]MBN2678338.1 HD domain-containing protein [Anaerolineaceae bacterium]